MQLVEVRQRCHVVGLESQGFPVALGRLPVLAVEVKDGAQVGVAAGVLQ